MRAVAFPHLFSGGAMDTKRLEQELELLRDSENERAKRKSGKARWLIVLLLAAGIIYGGNRWRQSAKLAANTTTSTPDAAGRGGRGGRGGGRGGAGRPAVL